MILNNSTFWRFLKISVFSFKNEDKTVLYQLIWSKGNMNKILGKEFFENFQSFQNEQNLKITNEFLVNVQFIDLEFTKKLRKHFRWVYFMLIAWILIVNICQNVWASLWVFYVEDFNVLPARKQFTQTDPASTACANTRAFSILLVRIPWWKWVGKMKILAFVDYFTFYSIINTSS